MSIPDSRIKHSVKFNLIVIGIGYFVPSRLQGICFSVLLAYLSVLRCRQGSGAYQVPVGRFKAETFHVQFDTIGGDVGAAQFDVQQRILCDNHFLKFTSFGCKLIQIGGFFVPEYVFSIQKFRCRAYFRQFYFLVVDSCSQFLWFLRDVDAQFRLFIFYKTIETSGCGMNGDSHTVLCVYVRFDQSRYRFLLTVGFRHTVVVIFYGCSMAVRIKFIDAK